MTQRARSTTPSIAWNGKPLKAMLWANRNGNFYVLDRTTGRFLLGKPFVKLNWMSGFDERGRPIETPQPAGMPVYPGSQGATNWYPPSYSPRTGLMFPFLRSLRRFACQRHPRRAGRSELAAWADQQLDGGCGPWRGPGDRSRNRQAEVEIPHDGCYRQRNSDHRVRSADYGREGYLQILQARTGELLWKTNLGAQMLSSPITYSVNGKQYVATIAGLSLFTFALP